GEGGFTVNYGGVPAGSDSVTINYSVDGPQPEPSSPVPIPVPPNSGSLSVFVPSSGFDLFNGSVVANPSGATVGLPNMFCSAPG
ncbi:MAG: hypothetical protein ABI970_21060, partial [Chloroflexota bacterium]